MFDARDSRQYSQTRKDVERDSPGELNYEKCLKFHECSRAFCFRHTCTASRTRETSRTNASRTASVDEQAQMAVCWPAHPRRTGSRAGCCGTTDYLML